MIKYAVNLWGKDIEIETEESRDSYLTNFGRATLENRYMSSGESYQDLFARVATHYADDSQHAQRLYDYISKLWFMRQHLFYRMVARKEDFLFLAFLMKQKIQCRALLIYGMKMSGCHVAAAVSEVTGERCEALARKLEESDKLQVLFRS